MRRWILLWCVFWTLACMCGGFGSEGTDSEGPEPFIFEVPQGSSANALAPAVVEAGFFNAEWEWKIFVRFQDASCIKAGRFEVSHAMSPIEFLETLCGTPLSDDVPFTVVEGWRIVDTDRALAAKGWIEPGDYLTIATGKTVDAPFDVPSTTFEGYLWPETYRVNADRFDAERFVERQLAMFKQNFLDDHPELRGERLQEVVVMASMIEQEERNFDNRPFISGILWNRIKKPMPLGVDATSRYTLEKWNDNVLPKIRDRSDPYNTRYRNGLPPTAIGAPGSHALQAALNPKPNPYYFYLHDRDCVLRVAKTNAGHRKNKKTYGICE
ncbi:MAG: endolytic transglycosylase MltG [Myxococcota bacterium]